MPWLLKSEADVYSIDQLRQDGVTTWEGVRNYQARNFLRSMRVGQKALFYHSNSDPTGVVGVCEVSRRAYPDPTQFDAASPYFDARSPPDAPRWDMVDVRFVAAFDGCVSLADIKGDGRLARMAVVQPGQRLSVQPVTQAQFARIVAKGGLDPQSL